MTAFSPGSADHRPPENFECRRAGRTDIDALVDLRIDFMRIVKDGGLPDEAAWRAELARVFARDLAAETLRVWVAVERGEGRAGGAGRVIGTSGLALGRHGAGPGEGEILNVYTIPERRRRGVASALLALVLDEARRIGLARARLQPTPDSRRLYERAGFRDEGRDMLLELG